MAMSSTYIDAVIISNIAEDSETPIGFRWRVTAIMTIENNDR